ncbi:endonuclease/exonuclease/phosphatase family protein [Sphingobacterium haloxyli]|uniref:Endonuclease/exonuclease/phosphatase family protein n=1 Tax=Sphingobacterium haloxyli TaxID=2100533 RepID=A0A2S9J140_9SPHI|nr:endonuclease/exonuclease/phosphatase family protein [Sphingobacterium haloxyli]PRD46479.1 endonuclease/exonuclease/phosphatase family protein [Sphingobacterium haloxyli]
MKKLTYIALFGLLLGSCAQQARVSKQLKQQVNTTSIVKPVDYTYPADSSFTVLSWNVEHFLDLHDDPYIHNRREDNPPENTKKRISLLLKALKNANADVVVLQEFESAKFLKQLAQDSLPDMGYLYFGDAPSHNWYMNVVVMSRFPMGLMTSYGLATTPLPGFVNEQGRAESQNHINTRMWSVDVFPSENYSFLLTGVHLKAGRSERDIAMRKGQIALLTETFNRYLSHDPATNMLMAGDYNATPESEEIALLTKGTALKNHFVDTIDPEILSHPANAPTRRLDYILINENMNKEILDGGAKVVNFFSPETMRVISDHLPVVARFLKEDK